MSICRRAWNGSWVRFIVTPRMHGVHHSDRREEADSNRSSLLSAWDVLHRHDALRRPSITALTKRRVTPMFVPIDR